VVGLYRRNSMASKARSRRRQWLSPQAAFDGLHQRGMFKGWTEAALWAFVEHALKPVEAGVELKCRPSREADIFGSYPKRLWSSLAKVQTPTQVIYGEQTYPFVATSVARWAGQNPHISGQSMPGGHCFMQQYPEQAAQRVVAFLLG
jgi:pimeloyl-ACP methyl ester carboxylesterase